MKTRDKIKVIKNFVKNAGIKNADSYYTFQIFYDELKKDYNIIVPFSGMEKYLLSPFLKMKKKDGYVRTFGYVFIIYNLFMEAKKVLDDYKNGVKLDQNELDRLIKNIEKFKKYYIMEEEYV